MAKNKDKEKKETCGCNDPNCTCDKDSNCNEENCTCNNETCECGSKEAEYLELAQRLKAEFDNYKRRNAEVSKASFENGVMTTVSKLLPVMDSFQQARSSIKDEQTLKGLTMIEDLILKGFKDLNVEKIECLGKEFDPNLHNAVLTGKEDNKPDGIILDEYQAGFKMGDKVIRHSVVRINKLN